MKGIEKGRKKKETDSLFVVGQRKTIGKWNSLSILKMEI